MATQRRLVLSKSLREVPEASNMDMPLMDRLDKLKERKEMQRLAKEKALADEKRSQVRHNRLCVPQQQPWALNDMRPVEQMLTWPPGQLWEQWTVPDAAS